MLEKSKVYPPSSRFLPLPAPLRLPASRLHIRLVVFWSHPALLFLLLRRSGAV